MDLLPFSLDTIEMFLLMFVRVITIIMLLPIFGAWAIPAQIKVALSLFLTIVLFMSMPEARTVALPEHHSFIYFVSLVFKEILIGLVMGYTSIFLFAAVHFAARLVDIEMGLGMVELIDPMSEEQVTAIGQLWIVVFTIMLLLINGHYFFLLAIQKSYALIPVLGLDFKAGPLAQHFVTMAGEVFVLAVKMSAPIYVALILTEMALGVVARTVPQINIFFVGLPLKIMLGLMTAVFVFPMIGTLFRKMFEGLIKDIWSVLYLMA
ncbi:MAG: flagellar biosynthetic protein FliR [Chitinispirillaceae bacterium]|nr:flagellar biosynthetic protein FliR [Chitinispirillaceae bacterium]